MLFYSEAKFRNSTENYSPATNSFKETIFAAAWNF